MSKTLARLPRFLVLAFPLLAIAVVFAYGARSAEYVLNGSFEHDGRPWLGNWRGHNASLVSVEPGAVGKFAVRVLQRPGSREFALLPTGAAVRSTTAGQRYDGSGWVRSDRPGGRVVLGVREWRDDKLVGSAAASIRTTRRWQRFPRLSYTAKAEADELDLYVYERAARDGARFEVDDLSLAEPMTAVALDNAHVRLDWSATTGAARYAVYRGDLLVGTTRSRTFTDTLLWPATTYDFRVDALTEDGTTLGSRAVSATTTALPAAGFPRPFPATSFWNRPVAANASIDARSDAKIAYFLRAFRYPNLTLHAFAVPVAEAHPDDPRFSVRCTVYTHCTLGAFGRLPIPSTAQPDVEADSHLAIYDPVTKREWDMWQAVDHGGSWTASAGAAVSLKGNGVAPPGTAGANAANFPLLGGIVRPEEILQGHIDHGLVFTMPAVGRGRPVCPATHNGGSTSDLDALRQGQHLQLDPTIDVGALDIPSWERPIVRALQVYGMYLRDQGGTFAIYGENPISRGYDAWALADPALQTDTGALPLTGIPWERLRVLAAPNGPRCR